MDDLIDSVKMAVANQNWYAALVVTLTLPDIAGKVDNPTGKSGQRYADWFNRYILRPNFRFLSGNDCYALRCSYLHEGGATIGHQPVHQVLKSFMFVKPPSPEVGGMFHNNYNMGTQKLQLQVDLFCLDIIQGIETWLTEVQSDPIRTRRLKDFLAMYEFDDPNMHL